MGADVIAFLLTVLTGINYLFEAGKLRRPAGGRGTGGAGGRPLAAAGRRTGGLTRDRA